MWTQSGNIDVIFTRVHIHISSQRVRVPVAVWFDPGWLMNLCSFAEMKAPWFQPSRLCCSSPSSWSRCPLDCISHQRRTSLKVKCVRMIVDLPSLCSCFHIFLGFLLYFVNVAHHPNFKIYCSVVICWQVNRAVSLSLSSNSKSLLA